MKIKIENLYFKAILVALLIFFIAAMCYQKDVQQPSAKAELYPGQATVLALDAAHKYARENLAPSNFSLKMESTVTMKMFDNPKMEGVAKFTVRKPIVKGSIGSATAVKKVGYLLSAKHVASDEEFVKNLKVLKEKTDKENPGLFMKANIDTQLTLTDQNGKQFMAVLIACDDNELSLVRVKNLKGFTAKPIPISTEKDLSDKAVVVIGTPQGIENMIFDGRISKAGRIKTEDGTFMYVNASINPGNSGGMLATLGDMKLVGVMSQVEINSNPPSLTDIGLFVPNDIINKFLDKAMPK